MMTIWFGTLLLMAIACAVMAAWWGDNKPCYACMSYKRSQHECDSCGEPAWIYYCSQCLKKLFKRRTPRIKRFLALLNRIKKIRRGRKNKRSRRNK